MSTEISLMSGAFNSPQNFDLAQRVGKFLSTSTMVPERYIGNMSNCMVAIEMSARLNLSVMEIMQSLYIVHGTPAWAAKFKISQVNRAGKFEDLDYEWRGEEGNDNWGCRAFAKNIKTGSIKYGTWIDLAMAKAEGWFEKKGSKWKTMPEKMLYYRAASWWADIHSPEATMGLPTLEEAEEITIDTTYTDVTEEIKKNANKDPMGFTPDPDLTKKPDDNENKTDKDPEPENKSSVSENNEADTSTAKTKSEPIVDNKQNSPSEDKSKNKNTDAGSAIKPSQLFAENGDPIDEQPKKDPF